MIRCGVYLRQSEDADDDELAVSRQWNEIIEKICEPRGWEPVRYCDNDRSAVGAKRKLPDRDRMLADIEAGYLQAMAAWDCDRLYRETIDLEHIIEVAERNHTLLATVTGDIDLGTDNGRLFARIKGAVAKAETERRSARQKAKGLQLAEAGESWGPRRALGYERDGTVIPAEAERIAEAFDLFLAGHHSLTGLCRYWNELGFLTSLGNRWTNHNQVRKVLQNPRYAGRRTYNGKVIGDAKWDKIVELDVWQAVNDILADPSRRNGISTGRQYLLVGIARCGECASSKRVTKMATVKAHKGGRPMYRCRVCFGVIKTQELADRQVTAAVIRRLSRPDAADLLIDLKRPDLDALRREAKAAREKLATIAVKWADDELTDEQAALATKRAKERLSKAESAMEDANRARLFKGAVGDAAHQFPGFDLDRRRAIIDALMTVTFHRGRPGVFDPDSISIEWKVSA